MKCKVINAETPADFELVMNRWLSYGYEIVRTDLCRGEGWITMTIFFVEVDRSKSLAEVQEIMERVA